MRETQIPSKKGKVPQNLVILEALVDLASKAKAKGTTPFTIKTATGNQWMLANFTLSFFNC